MKTIASLLLLLNSALIFGQKINEDIYLNQLGFYPNGPKQAVLAADKAQSLFFLKNAADGKTVYTGKLSDPIANPLASSPNSIADFSSFQKPGNYYLEIPGAGRSYAFNIKKNVHRDIATAALKGFYYQRTAVDLPARYAGKWARAAGHPDNVVYIHASAASAARPEGTTISSPLGWYDAGDYNKYIVNSGISVATLLSLYEDFPTACKTVRSNIPESNNALPDVLDEALFNIRWMLTMQDPNDGGVYHKLTNANFDGMELVPAKATNKRFVVQKSVTASLDFAAVMAQASRVFRQYDKQLPRFADSCLLAAESAWAWAKLHPNALYNQSEINKLYEPDINTGEYGDGDANDEWIWAALELWAATAKGTYKEAVNIFPNTDLPLPSWDWVQLLGYYSLVRLESKLPADRRNVTLKANILQQADKMVAGAGEHPFHTVMGLSYKDYVWGSNAVAANQGIFLIQAYQISGDKKYLRAALSNLDYLLGRNATGYCFLTGFGKKQVMHPHHRPSISDSVPEPVPGLLSGGPNPGQQDKCPGYPTNTPDKSFVDADCSYASNEIAINWNAPMVYLAAALEILQKQL